MPSLKKKATTVAIIAIAALAALTWAFLSLPLSNTSRGDSNPADPLQPSIQNTSELHKDFLTEGAWTSPPPNPADDGQEPVPQLAPDRYSWEFAINNQVRWNYSSDYFITHEGYYKIDPVSNRSGIIFAVLQDMNSQEQEPSRVLRYDILNETYLEIAERTFVRQGNTTVRSFSDQGFQSVSYEMLDEHNLTANFPIWSRIAEKNWTMTEGDRTAINLRVIPETIAFEDAGNYTMVYSNGCTFSGTFSIRAEAEIFNNIRFAIPERDCDPRGNNDPFTWDAAIRLIGADRIMFEGVEYKKLE